MLDEIEENHFKELSSYMPYFQELRKKFISVIIIFLIGGVVGFLFSEKILLMALGMFNLKGINVVMTSPFQFMELSTTTGIVVGTIFAFPFFLLQLINFLKPALKKQEYKMVSHLLPLSFLLFVVGFAFGLYVMQFVINIFAQVTNSYQIGNLWDIQKLFSSIMMTATLLGLIFQFPILIVYLILLKIIDHRFLTDNRRYVYALLILFVLFLPPTDIFSDIILITPLFLMYEITLFILIKKAKGGEIINV